MHVLADCDFYTWYKGVKGMFKRGNKGNLEALTARRATLTLLDLRFHCGIFWSGERRIWMDCMMCCVLGVRFDTINKDLRWMPLAALSETAWRVG